MKREQEPETQRRFTPPLEQRATAKEGGAKLSLEGCCPLQQGCFLLFAIMLSRLLKMGTCAFQGTNSSSETRNPHWVWWLTPVIIPVFDTPRQDAHDFEA